MYPMLFLTVLFINVQASLTQIGQEKERGIKDALSLKGMRKEAFWATWFLVECAVMTTSCVVVVVAAKLVGVIDHTPMYQFFFSMWIYGCSLILLAFVMSSFFTEAKTMFIAAAIMLIIFSVITYLVELLMIRLDAPYLSVLATFTFSPIPFGHLLWTLSSGELMGRGWEEGLTRLEWNIENDYYYEAYFFLVFDCFLYIGLTLFLDSLVGDPLSFGRGPKNSDGAEQPTPGMGISVKNLSKLFKWTEKDKTNPMKKVKMEVQAVDGLNLDVEENMICCLLGHNGAGKTTSPRPPSPTPQRRNDMRVRSLTNPETLLQTSDEITRWAGGPGLRHGVGRWLGCRRGPRGDAPEPRHVPAARHPLRRADEHGAASSVRLDAGALGRRGDIRG